jgi:hypothetical protein
VSFKGRMRPAGRELAMAALEKVYILALKMTIFQKFGFRSDLGWPWLL